MNKHFRRSHLAWAAGLAAGSLLLSGCAGTGAAGGPSGDPISGGTLTYATGDVEPACLDPIVSGNVPQALVSTQYLESLFYQDENGDIAPWLAESWTWSEDRLSLDVTLRDDVTFTDGAPLNASTIAANVAYIKDPATLSSTALLAVEKVASVEEIDEYTARIHLSEPDNALLEHFSQVWVPIESQKALARGSQENCLSPVGTGPFKVESWQKQQQIVLVRNDNYTTPPPSAAHTGPAYLDKIVWRFLPDDTARFAALQAGEVDVIDVIQPQDMVAAQSDPTLQTLIGSRPGHVVNLALNTRAEPFDDIKIREAFIRSVDVDAALSSIFLGTVPRANSVLSSITKYNQQDPEAFSTDVGRANQLLDEAGWTQRDNDGYRIKDGKRLSVTVIQTSYVLVPVSMLEQFQAAVKAVGFELKISEEETSSFTARRNSWDYKVLPTYYTKNSPAVLNLTHDSSNIASIKGVGYHSNSTGLKSEVSDELDTVLRTAATTADESERGALYAKAQDIIYSQYLNLPIFDQQTRLGLRADVVGVRLISPLGMPTFYDAWLDRS
ncbi:ABC transporter substrate-binding protein [Rhodococcus sp. 1168]|uniref:ABC transporter substrate-binding protein n=1 Tax=Rhodococcus sp. 1168 TaxID=2018041 RepID=UPI000A0A30F9|nr:ABC transporter substrate-binding protein [Rhodococcus sp. 1168]ORI14790.1 oligopeptide ABC transporter substrate-binding protein [Rhodococcus sp. 1168]